MVIIVTIHVSTNQVNKQTCTCMGCWPSVRSRWLDIEQVLYGPRVYGPRRRGQYPTILTEQAWSIKDLLYGIKHQNMLNFPCGRKPVSRAARELHLARSGSQFTARDSDSSCPLTELVIKLYSLCIYLKKTFWRPSAYLFDSNIPCNYEMTRLNHTEIFIRWSNRWKRKWDTMANNREFWSFVNSLHARYPNIKRYI